MKNFTMKVENGQNACEIVKQGQVGWKENGNLKVELTEAVSKMKARKVTLRKKERNYLIVSCDGLKKKNNELDEELCMHA